MSVKPIPDGYHSLTPYLIVHDGGAALEYYTSVFGGQEAFRMPDPKGRIMHAEVKIGDSVLMLADEHPEMGYLSPRSIGKTPVSILLYVEDVDAVFSKALAEGGQEVKAVADQFYGDRTGTLIDPFGHMWTVATHKEDISEEEMNRRLREMMQQSS